MTKENGDMFVTYKWLFMTSVSVLVICLGFIYFSYSTFAGSLASKADIKWAETRADLNSARINTLCIQLEKMEIKQDTMLGELYNIKSMVKKAR